MNGTLSEQTETAEVELSFNILVAGYMAVTYSRFNPKALIKHWAGDGRFEAIREGNDRIIVANARHGKDLGLVYQIHRNHFGGGEKSVVEYWIPYSALENVKMVVQGLRRK